MKTYEWLCLFSACTMLSMDQRNKRELSPGTQQLLKELEEKRSNDIPKKIKTSFEQLHNNNPTHPMFSSQNKK